MIEIKMATDPLHRPTINASTPHVLSDGVAVTAPSQGMRVGV